MESTRKRKIAFRPSVGDIVLEERIVLNAGRPSVAAVARVAAARNDSITPSELHAAYARVFRGTEQALKAQVDQQIQHLYANGAPTAQELANFNGQVAGTIAGATFGLASTFALLPGSNRRLVPGLARAMVSDRPASLINRVSNATARHSQSPGALRHAIDRQINRAFQREHTRAANFFANIDYPRALEQERHAIVRSQRAIARQNGSATPIRLRDVARPTLSQYMGARIIGQFGDTLGSLNAAFPQVAQSVLYPNGATTATAADTARFQTMYANALGLATYQLGNNLQLFSNNRALYSNLQNLFYGSPNGTGTSTGTGGSNPGTGVGTGTSTGTGGSNPGTGIGPGTGTGTGGSNPGTGVGPGTGLGTAAGPFFNQLQNLPYGATGFNTAVNRAFQGGFSSFSSPVANFFGIPSTDRFNLPSSNFRGVFGTPYTGSSYRNGYLGGYGSGFPGFGVSPVGVPLGFGNGFSAYMTDANRGFGFNTPPFGGGTLGGGAVGSNGGVIGGGTVGSGGLGAGGTGVGRIGAGGTGIEGIGVGGIGAGGFGAGGLGAGGLLGGGAIGGGGMLGGGGLI